MRINREISYMNDSNINRNPYQHTTCSLPLRGLQQQQPRQHHSTANSRVRGNHASRLHTATTSLLPVTNARHPACVTRTFFVSFWRILLVHLHTHIIISFSSKIGEGSWYSWLLNNPPGAPTTSLLKLRIHKHYIYYSQTAVVSQKGISCFIYFELLTILSFFQNAISEK